MKMTVFIILLIIIDQLRLLHFAHTRSNELGIFTCSLQNDDDDEDASPGKTHFIYWRKYNDRGWWHTTNLLYKETDRKWPDFRGSGLLRFVGLLLMWLALWPVFLLLISLMGFLVFSITMVIECLSPGGMGPRRKPPTTMQLISISIKTAVSIFVTCFWNC